MDLTFTSHPNTEVDDRLAPGREEGLLDLPCGEQLIEDPLPQFRVVRPLNPFVDVNHFRLVIRIVHGSAGNDLFDVLKPHFTPNDLFDTETQAQTNLFHDFLAKKVLNFQTLWAFIHIHHPLHYTTKMPKKSIKA